MAIIGGGASGLCAAWLLDAAHDVQLFEAAPMLGGHIRTLGGNVPHAGLPAGVRLDAGVIEFDRVDFPTFHAWMEALGVRVERLPSAGSTNLFYPGGRHFHSPGALVVEHPDRLHQITEGARLLPLILRLRRFRRATATREAEGGPMDQLLGDDEVSTWVRSLLMYAYSLHYDEVRELSAAMAVPMLRRFLQSNDWTHIPGGVSTYVDAVVGSLRGAVHTGARVTAIRRDTEVLVEVDGRVERFDHVVIAVPPHRILPLLADADDTERGWLGAHTGHVVQTVVHTDTGPYTRRGIHAPTEFDLFVLEDGGHGYNAWLNRLADLGDALPWYNLAFDLDAEIDPRTVIHRQDHDVGRYSDAALRPRDALIRGNGRRNTWFAGAWLGDGLHEGAVRSAMAVAARLGGRTLSPAPTPR